jgi:hypothetical protein
MGERVLIVGMAKTGTTALFYKILNSMPKETRWHFEPSVYQPDPDESGYTLTKVLFGLTDVDSFASFERRIVLVRDPRDTFVSQVLYSVLSNSTFRSPARTEAVVQLLREKESNPRSVALGAVVAQIQQAKAQGLITRVFEQMAGIDRSRAAFRRYARRFAQRLSRYSDWVARQQGVYVARYEDLVGNQLQGLEAYLGFPLTGAAEVAPWVSQVVRTKGVGDWKNWLLPEDVSVVRKPFQAFIDAYGYPRDWTIANEPRIDPAHGSLYVRRIAEKMRAQQPPLA